MGNGRMAGRRGGWWTVVAAGLVILPAVAGADGPADRTPGRGWVWGASFGGGWLGFPGGEDRALALGPVEYETAVAGGSSLPTRNAWLVGSGETPDGADVVVPLQGEGALSFSFYGGYAFSRRLALVLDVDLSGYNFNHAVGGLRIQVWPASRLRLEVGPASGDLGFGYEDSVVASQSVTGVGVAGAVGFSVIRKPGWCLDLEMRHSRIAYDGFSATTTTFGLSAGTRPR